MVCPASKPASVTSYLRGSLRSHSNTNDLAKLYEFLHHQLPCSVLLENLLDSANIVLIEFMGSSRHRLQTIAVQPR